MERNERSIKDHVRRHLATSPPSPGIAIVAIVKITSAEPNIGCRNGWGCSRLVKWINVGRTAKTIGVHSANNNFLLWIFYEILNNFVIKILYQGDCVPVCYPVLPCVTTNVIVGSGLLETGTVFHHRREVRLEGTHRAGNREHPTNSFRLQIEWRAHRRTHPNRVYTPTRSATAKPHKHKHWS